MASSWDNAIVLGKSLLQELIRAPGNLLLSNQFQKWLNSSSLIGQKNIFLPNQRGRLVGDSVALLYEVVFFIDRPGCLACTMGRLSWRVSEKKYSTKQSNVAISTLLFLVARKASWVPKVT